MTIKARQPAGVPVGGQFAAHTHAEADVELEAQAPRPAVPIDGQLALRGARSALGRRAGRLSPAMRDDVVGEAAYELTKTVANGEAAGTPVALTPAYIQRTTRNVIAKLTYQETQSANRWAIKEYLALRAAAEQAEKRMLTVDEEDALAEDIRSMQVPKHRASAGFHRRNVLPVALRRADVVNIADPGPPSYADFEEGSLGDRLLNEIDDGSARSDAALRAWDALAERSGAPQVRQGVYSGRSFEGAVRAVREAGGALAIAKAWLHGDDGTRSARRLFEPFGAETEEDRRAVALLVLGAGPDYGEKLWRSACRAASDLAPPTEEP